MTPRAQKTKVKIDKTTKSKTSVYQRNEKQSEKSIYGMREDIYKSYIQ